MVADGSLQLGDRLTVAVVPAVVGPFRDPLPDVEQTGLPVRSDVRFTGSGLCAAVEPLPPPPPPQPASNRVAAMTAGMTQHLRTIFGDFTNRLLSQLNEH
jgi:hypothetical protein